MRTTSFYAMILLLLSACSPRIKARISSAEPALSPNARQVCLYPSETSPAEARLIGTIKIGDNGFSSNCGYDEVVNAALGNARQYGANLVHITSIRYPDGFSTCHRLRASLYHLDQPDAFIERRNAREDSISRAHFAGDTSYAMIHVYRDLMDYGFAISYKLMLNDSILFKVKDGSAQTIRIDQPGCFTLSAKTESGYDMNICVEGGKEYYLRCGVSMGVFIGRPVFYLVENARGRAEFEELLEP